MNKMLRFSLVGGWIILSRFYDAYCTYEYTPDLSHEANPLVSWLGLGWTPLLLIIFGLTFYTVYAYYLTLTRNYDFMPKEEGYSFWDMATHMYRGKKEHWSVLMYKLPASWDRLHYFFGTYMAPCLSFLGIVSTIMWLLIKYTENYMNEYHSLWVIYSTLIIGSLVIFIFKALQLYKEYKSQSYVENI